MWFSILEENALVFSTRQGIQPDMVFSQTGYSARQGIQPASGRGARVSARQGIQPASDRGARVSARQGIQPASGRGARVSACAGLINQLQSCRFDPRIACLVKHWHSNCRRLVDGGEGTPRHVLLTGAKTSHMGFLISFQLPMGFQNFIQILIKFTLYIYMYIYLYSAYSW